MNKTVLSLFMFITMFDLWAQSVPVCCPKYLYGDKDRYFMWNTAQKSTDKFMQNLNTNLDVCSNGSVKEDIHYFIQIANFLEKKKNTFPVDLKPGVPDTSKKCELCGKEEPAEKYLDCALKGTEDQMDDLLYSDKFDDFLLNAEGLTTEQIKLLREAFQERIKAAKNKKGMNESGQD